MQPVCAQDGPSLPLGRKLHWLFQLQVLYLHALLHFDNLQPDNGHVPPRGQRYPPKRRRKHSLALWIVILCGDCLWVGAFIRIHHHFLPAVPSMADK